MAIHVVGNGKQDVLITFGPGIARCWVANITLQRSIAMKQSMKDRVKGKAHEVKGAVKEKFGRATNNPDLEAEGKGEKVAGKVQKKVGDVEKVLEK